MSGGQGSSSQQQQSGLRGTTQEQPQVDRTAQANQTAQNWSSQVMQNPNLFMGQTGKQLYDTGRYGLGFNVDQAVNQLMNQNYSLASSGGASRGRLTPEGAAATAGDAMTQVLPQLIPQIAQMGQWQFELPMNMNTAASNIANANAATQTASLGSQGQGNASNWNLGFLQGPAGGAAATAALT